MIMWSIYCHAYVIETQSTRHMHVDCSHVGCRMSYGDSIGYIISLYYRKPITRNPLNDLPTALEWLIYIYGRVLWCARCLLSAVLMIIRTRPAIRFDRFFRYQTLATRHKWIYKLYINDRQILHTVRHTERTAQRSGIKLETINCLPLCAKQSLYVQYS